jgi:hypothetical protein
LKSKKQKLNYGQVKGCQPLKKRREKKIKSKKRSYKPHKNQSYLEIKKNERERESEEDEES